MKLLETELGYYRPGKDATIHTYKRVITKLELEYSGDVWFYRYGYFSKLVENQKVDGQYIGYEEEVSDEFITQRAYWIKGGYTYINKNGRATAKKRVKK